MKKEVLELFQMVSSMHQEAVVELDGTKKKSYTYSSQEHADFAYCLRECINHFNDLVKELEKVKRAVEYKACSEAMTNDTLVIGTLFCTATVDVGLMVEVPKLHSQPAEYTKLMQHLGVKQEFIDLDMVRVHWPNFQEYMNNLSKEMKPLPPGMENQKKHPQLKLKIRKRKDLDA